MKGERINPYTLLPPLMFDLDKWQEIFNTIQRHKLRTLLTAFGVFWGIFMLVLLLGAGRGIEKGVYSNFGQIATNSFFMWGRTTRLAYKGFRPGRWIRLTNEDIDAIREQIPEAAYIAPFAHYGERTITSGTKSGSFMVLGFAPEAKYLRPLEIQGRFLNLTDMKEKRKVAIIGKQVQKVLFGKEDPIGQYINIQGVFFQVAGVFDTKGIGGDSGALEEIYIPLTTLQQAYNRGNTIGWFGAVVDPAIPVEAIEERTKNFLKKRHSVAPEDVRAIGSWNAGKEFGQLQALFRGIRMFIWVVGAGTIVAGIVGVSNIMLIIVKERTREIGIRKALGATPFSIISLILQESIFITALSGYMGLVASVGLLELASYLMNRFQLQSDYFNNPEIEFGAAITATIILVITGALAGFIPARTAARINPIEALRSE